MKKRIIGKLITLLIAGVLIFCLMPVSGGWDKKKVTVIVEKNKMMSAGNTDHDSDVISRENADMAVKKSETVKVKAKADGTVTQIKVSEWLQNNSLNKTVTDVSTLDNIKNTEGNEEFTRNGDTIIWENYGENISYEGTSDKELPVSVRVRYFLEGREVSPEEMAGQTGNVKIRFEYTNHTEQTVLVDGKEVQSAVPFIMCSMLYLPSDIFSNVEVENGSVMESQEQSIVLGYCIPGISDYFDFASYEPTEEIEFEDFMEVTAYAKEFELEFTATVAAVGLLDELELEDLEDIDEMIDDMKELEKGTNELCDGTDKLYDGVKELKGGISEYMDAVDAVNNGVGEIENGVAKLAENNDALKEGSAALSKGLAELNTVLNGLELPENIDMSQITDAVIQFHKDAAILSGELAALQTAIEEAKQVTELSEEYKRAVEKQVSAAEILLGEMNIEELVLNANALAKTQADEQAKEQAKNAASQALSGSFENSGLSEDEIAALKSQIETAFFEAVDGNVSVNIDVSSATEELSGKVEEVKAVLTAMPELNIPDVVIDDSAIQAVIADMNVQLEKISAAQTQFSGMVTELSALRPMLLQLKGAVGQMDTGAKALSEGVTAYTGGVMQLLEGVKALHEGTGELASVRGELGDGFNELCDGVNKLRDGVREFRDEGISELTKFAGEELRNLLNSLRASKALNDTYNNFAGIAEGMEGDVIFIIETEGIEK